MRWQLTCFDFNHNWNKLIIIIIIIILILIIIIVIIVITVIFFFFKVLLIVFVKGVCIHTGVKFAIKYVAMVVFFFLPFFPSFLFVCLFVFWGWGVLLVVLCFILFFVFFVLYLITQSTLYRTNFSIFYRKRI